MPKTTGSFRKGDNRSRKPKGAENKTTKEAKEILNSILFGEISNIKEALNAIREKDKYRYIDCLAKLFPFVIPKKSDLTSDDEPLTSEINITVTSEGSAEKLKEFINGKPE